MTRVHRGWVDDSGPRAACLATVAALLLATVARSEPVPVSKDDLSTALEQAKSRQQPLLLYFTATWCGPCQVMSSTTFPDPAVSNTLDNLTFAVLDVDEVGELARTRGITAVPTFQLLSSSGDLVAETTGYQRPEQFVAWITNGLNRLEQVVRRNEELEATLDRASALLESSDPSTVQEAVSLLCSLCADRQASVRRRAGDRLKRLADEHPAQSLDGLNHPRLAARIHVANLLREQLGDEFDVDPWSDEATRREGVALWRTRLQSDPPAEESD